MPGKDAKLSGYMKRVCKALFIQLEYGNQSLLCVSLGSFMLTCCKHYSDLINSFHVLILDSLKLVMISIRVSKILTTRTEVSILNMQMSSSVPLKIRLCIYVVSA